ncbi:MAG: sulfite exporter TauE/SafE family protein [Bacteroidia bacterium]|nr:sulfite exporter TauE/SafE family protein [Bacteroidia bacterium]
MQAFGWGLLSFFSPCVFPLVPAYIANLAGASSLENDKKQETFTIILHSISFVIGFSIVYILIGAAVGTASTFLKVNRILLSQIGGSIIIIFGLYLIGSLKFPWLNYENRLHLKGARNPTYIRSLLIGSLFAIGWTPCVGPIVAQILTQAIMLQNTLESIKLVSVYCIGLGVPFILTGIAWGYIMPMWKTINRHLAWITLISGILLIITGILIITGVIKQLGVFAI